MGVILDQSAGQMGRYQAPQVGLEPSKPRNPQLTEQQRNRKPSGHPLEAYCKLWAEHITRQQERHRKLFEMSATIHRRYRGLTLSDQCGRYGVRRETQGRWLDYDPELDGEIHPINIVGPAIATNQNACLQSNSEIEVASANQNAENKQNAIRWQRVADYFERTGWDEAERAFIFDAVQKDGTCLIYSFREPVDEQTVAAAKERKLGLAVYQCGDGNCNSKGLTETSGVDEGMQTIPCPKCDKPAQGMVKHLEGYEIEEQGLPIYRIGSEPIPLYHFTVDAYGGKIKGIQGMKWLQVQELMDRMELEDLYSAMTVGSPLSWSYPLRVDYALASGFYELLNHAGMVTNHDAVFDKFERRSIYLHESAYSNWVSPADYSFTNSKGKTTFEIKQNETIEEAFQKMYGEDPDGFKFIWINDRLMDIVSPEDEETNLRKCFSDVHWRRDSGGYLSSPNYSIVIIQDDITLLNTMNHNIIARNAVNPVYYDSTVFEKADFQQEHIGSKNAHLLEDRDLSKSVVQLPVPTPSPYLGRQLEFLWQIKDDVTQVTPALRGASQTGETLGAVRQQLEQSYGQLTSVLKSFAQCKVSVFKQKADLAKKFWTVEQFQRVGSMFGEMWSEEDIEDMCQVSLDEDLICSYRTGSEMPQSNLDKQLKFSQAMASLVPLLQAGAQLAPDKLEKIMQKVGEMGDIDFDLTGLEIDELIAQKKYLELAMLCAEYGQISQQQIDTARQTPAAIDNKTGQPISQLDLVIEQVFARSEIRFSQYEDLDQQKTFFTEQLRREIGKGEPNYLLIEMMTYVLHAIEQAAQVIAQQQMAANPQMQMMQQEQQLQQQQQASDNANQAADRETELQKAKLQSATEMAKLEATHGHAERVHTADLVHKTVSQAADQHHDAKKQAVQGQIDSALAAAKQTETQESGAGGRGAS